MPHVVRPEARSAPPRLLARAPTAYDLRPGARSAPRAIVIGASTGGPQALGALLQALAPHIAEIPVFVVLHMPADFNEIVAQHIARQTGLPASVAKDGEAPQAGHVYFAPGGRHLRLAKEADGPRMRHADDPPEQFLKPSVNHLFRSAARVYGHRLLGVVLTGMGSDGLAGAHDVIAHGGAVMVQDEGSAVVWGMPGAIAREGLACAVLPIGDLAHEIASLLCRHRAGGGK